MYNLIEEKGICPNMDIWYTIKNITSSTKHLSTSINHLITSIKHLNDQDQEYPHNPTTTKDLRAKGKYAPVWISDAQQNDESNIIKGLFPTQKSIKHQYTK